MIDMLFIPRMITINRSAASSSSAVGGGSGDEALLLKYLQAAEEVACLSLQVPSFAIPLPVPSFAYVIVVVIVGVKLEGDAEEWVEN